MLVCDAGHVHRETCGAVERGRQRARPCVVVGEARHVVLERVQPRGRDDPGLPHAAAEQLAQPAAARDRLGGGDQHRADRRAEALREAERHAVGTGAGLRQCAVARDGRVRQARAVHVHAQAELVRSPRDARERLAAPDARRPRPCARSRCRAAGRRGGARRSRPSARPRAAPRRRGRTLRCGVRAAARPRARPCLPPRRSGCGSRRGRRPRRPARPTVRSRSGWPSCPTARKARPRGRTSPPPCARAR